MLRATTTTKGAPVVYLPFSIILAISMIKDFIEDTKKRKADKKQNSQLVQVYRRGRNQAFSERQARELRVGDIVKVMENQSFPADVVFLYGNNQQRKCYLDTKNLDGESNLKVISQP